MANSEMHNGSFNAASADNWELTSSSRPSVTSPEPVPALVGRTSGRLAAGVLTKGEFRAPKTPVLNR